MTLAGPRFSGPSQITLAVPDDGVTLRVRNLTLTQPLTIVGSGSRGAPARLAALTESTLLAPLTLPDLALTDTTFVRTTGLEHLRILGDAQWPRPKHRRELRDEERLRDSAPDEVEVLYRQLRVGLEASKAAPAAADFYYGEMEMRRLATRHRSFERALLLIYKWVGGYGVRAWRPLVAYLTTLAFTTAAIVNPRGRRRFLGDTLTIDNLHVDRIPRCRRVRPAQLDQRVSSPRHATHRTRHHLVRARTIRGSVAARVVRARAPQQGAAMNAARLPSGMVCRTRGNGPEWLDVNIAPLVSATGTWLAPPCLPHAVVAARAVWWTTQARLPSDEHGSRT